MRGGVDTLCGCFPTGRHYPGIADRLSQSSLAVEGLAHEFNGDLHWPTAPLVVIDFETTGLDASQDRVLEIGAASFDAGRSSGVADWLVNPEMPVPEESRKVHGIGDEELAKEPVFAQLMSTVAARLEGRIPVAYNAGFDRGFLLAEVDRAVRERPELRAIVEKVPAFRAEVEWIDPLVWVRELQKYEKGKKLTEVCARMGISLERAHRAGGDALAAGEVLMKLSERMPARYGELIRVQQQYAARQEAELAAWRARR